MEDYDPLSRASKNERFIRNINRIGFRNSQKSTPILPLLLLIKHIFIFIYI